MSDSLLGLPTWLWVVLLVACALVGAGVVRRGGAKRRLAEEESLAQRADADHEGAKTRHGGGA